MKTQISSGSNTPAFPLINTTLIPYRSDGPQPHHLHIHFNRFAAILAIRIYLDFDADESYTPTRIFFFSGTGHHDLTQFATLEFTKPKGWIEVPLTGVGGKLKGHPEYDGNVLRAFLLQVKVVENHQNGKDTHIRGLKIWAKDESVGGGATAVFEGLAEARKGDRPDIGMAVGKLSEPDWMREPEWR
jgi:anaphase-promoting complex subunit 10